MVNILKKALFKKAKKMTREISHAMTAQDCLVALMVAISVSDETIRTSELVKDSISGNNLPIFAEYDIDRLNTVSQIVLIYSNKKKVLMPYSA